MRFDKILELMNDVKGGSADVDDMAVTKSVPMTDQELADHAALSKKADKINAMLEDLYAGRQKLWAQISLRLDYFGSEEGNTGLTIDPKAKEILFREPKK